MSFFGSLKTTLAAAFWISCRVLIVNAGRPAKRALQKSSLERTIAWTRSCAASSDWKGLIVLMLYKENLQNRAQLRVSWLSWKELWLTNPAV